MLNIAPHRYVSSSGALQDLGSHLEDLGERALVVANKAALDRFEDVVRSSLKDSMIGVSFEICLGECCLPEIERITEEAKDQDADIIVGIGGGRVLDVVKYSARQIDTHMVTVPSVASSFAAFSDLVYMFNEDGDFLEIRDLDVGPDLTLIDYKVAGLAPSQYLRAGMGIAVAITHEFYLSHEELSSDVSTQIAYEISSHLQETLFDQGGKAIEHVKKGELTTQIETVVEANILVAGLINSLGGEAFRSVMANYFAASVKPYLDEEILFGEVVAFGAIAQELLKETQNEELVELVGFYEKVGLPLSYDSIGLPDNQREVIVEDASEAISNHLSVRDLPFNHTPEDIIRAFDEANELGQTVIQSGAEAIV